MASNPPRIPSAPEAPQMVKLEVGDTLERVVFEKRNKSLRSSAPDRKLIEPETGATIEEGKAYRAVVVSDTDPTSASSGKLIVRILGEAGDITPEKWKEVEERVIGAEKPARKATKRAAEAALLTELAAGKPMSLAQRLGMKTEEAIEQFKKSVEEHEARLGASASKAKRAAESSIESKRAQEAMREEAAAVKEVEEILGPGEVNTLENTLVNFRLMELKDALHKDADLQEAKENIAHPPKLSLSREQEAERKLRIIKRQLKGIGVTSASAEVSADIAPKIEAINAQREELMKQSPEAFIGLHLKDLKAYRRQFDSGKIVETPYVETQALEMESCVRRGQPVFIYGHLGSGKTELALHVAEKVLKDREDLVERDEKNKIVKDRRHALVISGSKYMSQSELYGHQVLAMDKLDQSQIRETVKEVEDEFESWKASHKEDMAKMTPEERVAYENRGHDRILQTFLSTKRGGTISDFYLGPVYQAMEDGRPVIIDEVNAIPHEVLISLNHVLTRRPGDVVNVQQDSGKQIMVKEGYDIIMTGNLNVGAGDTAQKYVSRERLDPAFISRLKLMEHDYLPQNTELPFKDASGVTTPSTEGVKNELYSVMIASMMDKQGNMEAPKDAMERLWAFAGVMRKTQEAFSGKRKAEFASAGARAVPVPIQYAVISMRGMKSVIDAWQADGYQKPLEREIFDILIKDQPLPQERAWLYQQFQNAGFFDTNEGWANSSGLANVQSSFDVKPPKAKTQKIPLEFRTPRDLVTLLYGDVPERTRWPVYQDTPSEESEQAGGFSAEKAEKLAEFQAFAEKMEKEIEELSKMVEAHCALEQKAASAA